MQSQLFAGEKVYYDKDFRNELLGDGKKVHAAGDVRLLSRTPRVISGCPSFATPFEEVFQPIPRGEWSDRIKEQIEKNERVSDYQNFKSHDQNGLPTCWSNGPAHAATTMRVIQGLPYVELSACSVAVPISGGHVGGNEDTAVEYAAKHGWCSTKVWGNNDTSRRLLDDATCNEDRKHHVALKWLYLGNRFENYATAALMALASAVAYNDWAHVVSVADLVEIEPGHFGLRDRNNWSDNWGAKNKYGYGGYAVFPEGARSHGCPDSGFVMMQITSSIA